MKKTIFSTIIGAVIISMSVSAASTMNFTINGTNVDVYGETDEVKTAAHSIYVPADKSYISTDDIKTFLGAKAEIAGEDSVTLEKSGNTYTVDGCITKDGVFYVPLRTAAEMAGFDVEYVYSHNSILISDKPAAAKINGKTGVSSDQFEFFLGNALADDQQLSQETVSKIKQDTLNELVLNAIVYQTAANSGFSSTILDTATKTAVKEKSELFERPSIFALENEKFLVLNVYANTVSDAILVDEEEIADYYANNFVTAKHILVLSEGGKSASDKEAKAEAERILKQLKSGKDFDELMNAYSEDTGLQIAPDGYTFTTGEMVKEFEDAAFSLDENEISDVVKTSYGYHIVKRLPLAELSDEVKNKVDVLIRNQKYTDYMSALEESAVVEINEDVVASIN